MSDEHDSWFQEVFGVNLGGAAKRIEEEARAAQAQVTNIVQTVQKKVDPASVSGLFATVRSGRPPDPQSFETASSPIEPGAAFTSRPTSQHSESPGFLTGFAQHCGIDCESVGSDSTFLGCFAFCALQSGIRRSSSGH